MKALRLFPQPSVKLFTVLMLVLGTASAAVAEPYRPPAGLGAPARRESAGTRGCVFGNPASLIALMPENNIGWTTDASPRFYWYLPVNQASWVEFTLEQASETADSPEVIYQTRFAVTGEAGIVSLQLPETVSLPSLVEGDRYRWQVSIFCSPTSEVGELQVDGWIERQVPNADLMAAIAAASESDKLGLYADNGYWFNAIDQLVALQTADPENPDLQTRWIELLESVGLEALANQPLLRSSSTAPNTDPN
ncbi:MAG: DUF928 domain-containing protein [Leptolyngbya sp. SIO1E4]|nr:DUF928 domain-containing protein [Leptolyngbya sp. SIO1E4]